MTKDPIYERKLTYYLAVVLVLSIVLNLLSAIKIFALYEAISLLPRIVNSSVVDQQNNVVLRKASAVGTLAGKVSIGPICPVERIDTPCPVPPETYTSREFLVLSSDKSKTITSFHADANGNYNISLPPGGYVVTSAKTGIGYMSKDLPRTVIIKANQTTILDISVDMGIR